MSVERDFVKGGFCQRGILSERDFARGGGGCQRGILSEGDIVGYQLSATAISWFSFFLPSWETKYGKKGKEMKKIGLL